MDSRANRELINTILPNSNPQFQISLSDSNQVEFSGVSKIESASLHVGDIVLVQNLEEFPADILCLTSSNETGEVFVNTANLDGETTPKVIHDNVFLSLFMFFFSYVFYFCFFFF